MLTEGSVGVGTRWRETRAMMKKEAVEEMEVTAFESPSYYTVHCDSCGYVVEWTFRVEPSAGGSTLSLVMTSTAQTSAGQADDAALLADGGDDEEVCRSRHAKHQRTISRSKRVPATVGA